MLDTCSAFVTRFDEPIRRSGSTEAPRLLEGLTVAVKDNFDVAGHITGAGSPEYAAERQPAAAHAEEVEALLDQGAHLVGKTHMDELAFSLMGLNARYGVPVNPAAPDRVPGGSSSGSASAVAAGLADIGLGTDTGGSVRLPASFCGLYGWRASHGLLSPKGLVALARSYDVPGFFTRDAHTMDRVMQAFAPAPTAGEAPRFWLPDDLWALADESVRAQLLARLPSLNADRRPLLPEGGAAACLQAFRMHQGHEIWQHFGAWIQQSRPQFGPGIRERFDMTSRIGAAEFDAAASYRAAFTHKMQRDLAGPVVLVYPTSPSPAPLLCTPQSELEPLRNKALSLLAVSGHAGLPQLSVPAGSVDGAPVGLSFTAASLQDRLLLQAARHLGLA